jgi:hypothetical protein
MIEELVAAVLIFAVFLVAIWRPEATVIGLGIFLFVQSAVIRLDPIGPDLRQFVRRADEIVLAALLARAVISQLARRRMEIPTPLWGLAAFVAVGGMSAILNGVPLLQASVGIFLAVKAGLWMYVGRSLRVDEQTLVRYGYLLGSLFLGAVAIAILQVLGLAMPWQASARSGQVAATSIWNQHTAFGAALTVAIGLSVAALRLPGERAGAMVLLAATGTGILLSTVRRLLISMPVAAIATVALLPPTVRRSIGVTLHGLRRPRILALVAVLLVVGTIAVGPRLVSLANFTWERYVVDLESRDRYLLYEGAAQLLAESPLVGRGPGTYGSYASVIFDSPAYDEVGFTRRSSVRMAAPYGSLIAEYGILGVLAFASFVILLFRALLPIARGTQGTLQAALATAGIFMLVDMVVESVVNPVFSNSFITFFTFVGVGVAMSLEAERRSGQPSVWAPSADDRRARIGSLIAALTGFAALVGGVWLFIER